VEGRRRLYMGVDIAEGAPGGRRRPLYAVAIVDGEGRLVASQSGVPLSRVIRLAWDYRPERVAFDNVLELAPSARELERVLSMFPPESVVVQVTLDERGGGRRLRDAARERGIDLGPGKPSPARTAYALAVLAALGEGVPVREVEEKTIITVTRGRSPGRGGQSQRRLERRVRASVHQAAMRIKEALDREGLDYDFSYRESVGGLESATFTVYAPRTRLYGVVRPHRGQDYVVTVKPVYKTRLSLPAAEAPSRPVILGVDPGITTGVAILGLDGRVLYLGSGKGLDRGSILELVRRYGHPVVVAVDVAHVPEAVRKIASQLGAEVYSPPQDLSTAEKRDLAARAAGKPPVDSHQRDALAAAYKAYTVLRRKLEQVEREVSRLGIEVDVDTVKEAVARGSTIAEALEAAIEERLAPQERAEPRPPQRSPGPRVDVEYMASRIAALEAENRALYERITRLERLLEEARMEAERARREARAELLRDAEVRALKAAIAALERQVERLRAEARARAEEAARLAEALVRVARGELVLVRVLPSLTARNIRRSEERLGPILPGEVLLVESPSVVEEEALRAVAEAGAAGVVYPAPPPRLARRYMVPFVEYGRVERLIVRVSELVLAEARVREELEEERRRMEREREERLSLERIIEEYRRSRRAGPRP